MICCARGLGKRIAAFFDDQKYDQGLTAAGSMMELAPDKARSIVEGALDNIDRQLDSLRRQIDAATATGIKDALEQQRTKLVQAAEPLARLLIESGIRRHLDKDQLFPYMITQARCLRLAGKFQEAIDTLKPLTQDKKYDLDQDVLQALSESYFALNTRPSLAEADRYYLLLINGLQKPDAKTGRHAPLFWNAWLRHLQIMDRTGQPSADITSRIERLKAMDADLGGEAFATEFERLNAKHLGRH